MPQLPHIPPCIAQRQIYFSPSSNASSKCFTHLRSYEWNWFLCNAYVNTFGIVICPRAKYIYEANDAERHENLQERYLIFFSNICNAVPLHAWSGPEGSRKLRFPDFMTTAQDDGKVVSHSHRPPLPPGNTPGTHFCYRLSLPQGYSAIGRVLCQWKIPMTAAGIEPATFRFVAQHLNHCHRDTLSSIEAVQIPRSVCSCDHLTQLILRCM